MKKSDTRSPFQRIQDQLKWVDLVFEVRDARLPQSSGHPEAQRLFGIKPRVVVLAKADLSEPAIVDSWLRSLSQRPNQQALSLALKQSRGKQRLIKIALSLTREKREAQVSRGLLPRPMRAMVVGMPNVGKSSFINWLIGERKTRVGNKPGVTKGTQWVRLHPQLELLDTPGILPPTAFDRATMLKLALLNLVPEGSYNPEETASEGLSMLSASKPDALKAYGLDLLTDPDLTALAKARNCLKSGGHLDTRKAASILLSDIRSGRLGHLTLETP